MNWGYETVSQDHLDGRKLNYARGKGLGGSSAINICCYTVGPKEDYDEWARRVGDDSFAWTNTRHSINKIANYDLDVEPEYQKYARPSAEDHGTNGPLRIEFAKV